MSETPEDMEEFDRRVRERFKAEAGNGKTINEIECSFSVVGGRGTASGWIEVGVDVQRSKFCYCVPMEKHCSFCSDEDRRLYKEIHAEIGSALKAEGMDVYHYYDDMGYEHSEVLVQIDFLPRL